MVGIAAVGVALALGACSPAEEKAPETPAPEAAAPAPEAAPSAEAEAPAVTAVALAITDTSGATMTGDPTRGQRIFAQCATCHTLEAGVNRVGPSLHDIIGRQAGQVTGFRYSDANRNSGITWSEQELFNYLENPRARIPGTIMAFAGLRNPQQRADIIAYLKSNAEQ
jgi:cytochrome c